MQTRAFRWSKNNLDGTLAAMQKLRIVGISRGLAKVPSLLWMSFYLATCLLFAIVYWLFSDQFFHANIAHERGFKDAVAAVHADLATELSRHRLPLILSKKALGGAFDQDIQILSLEITGINAPEKWTVDMLSGDAEITTCEGTACGSSSTPLTAMTFRDIKFRMFDEISNQARFVADPSDAQLKATFSRTSGIASTSKPPDSYDRWRVSVRAEICPNQTSNEDERECAIEMTLLEHLLSSSPIQSEQKKRHLWSPIATSIPTSLGKRIYVTIPQAASGIQTRDVPGSFWRMLYFSAATITTVGFGDITPISPLTRALVAIEALSGILFIGLFINAIAHEATGNI